MSYWLNIYLVICRITKKEQENNLINQCLLGLLINIRHASKERAIGHAPYQTKNTLQFTLQLVSLTFLLFAIFFDTASKEHIA